MNQSRRTRTDSSACEGPGIDTAGLKFQTPVWPGNCGSIGFSDEQRLAAEKFTALIEARIRYHARTTKKHQEAAADLRLLLFLPPIDATPIAAGNSR